MILLFNLGKGRYKLKIGIIHISDFHICEGERVINEKIEKFLKSLNILGNVDEYVIVFSGDLAKSGKVSEYRISRYIIGKIISGIKTNHHKKYVDLFMIPGNHDLLLTEESRDGIKIQKAYDENIIETLVDDEISMLENYYKSSHASAHQTYDKLLDRRYCSYGENYKIQFNLINTALFSTLKPDDKELHYFPKEKMLRLKKSSDVNICITVMHHSFEWFNWNYKSDLEKVVINNSELLLMGHDHCEKTKKVSIDNSMDTWISCAGAMKFSNMEYIDSFNALVIDTDKNIFSGYVFNWNFKDNIYVHKITVDHKILQSRTSRLMPLPSYIKELKEDTYGSSSDFTQYFVFPKLVNEKKNEFGKNKNITDVDEFLDFLNEHNRILIRGNINSGKSTLLKYLYCHIAAVKTPLLLTIDSRTKIKPVKFIKQLFEEQYGDDAMLFEKYQQLDLKQRILIIDGWDNLPDNSDRKLLMSIIEEHFAYIVFSANNSYETIVDTVKGEINNDGIFAELRIKPFFAEKRNQLVRNICLCANSINEEEIIKVNKLIDSLVNNNSSLFTLNPAFIIRYTDYFIKDHSYDYAKGEAVFSKIFEFGIQSSIMKIANKADVDEIVTTFEELAGYIYSLRNDTLEIEEFRKVITKYNDEYGVKISPTHVLKIGIKSKILIQNEDLSVYFANKNYLAYFIAKYLLRVSQSIDEDYSGIEYALRNICFGINSDIILFISYLSNNTRTVMRIAEQAGELLSPWEELNFDKNNIEFIRYSKIKPIVAPTEDEQKKIKVVKEHIEESSYADRVVEAKGLFNYDEADIDKYPFRLIRAIKYTEMLCKALPAFNNVLKVDQKKNLIESIYSYPHKIVYALLKPIDDNLDEFCDELLKEAEARYKDHKLKKLYTKDDIIDRLNLHAIGVALSIYDHFAELCTSPKTISLLSEKVIESINQRLEKLMIKENFGDTDSFVADAEDIKTNLKNEHIQDIIRLIVRKHLLCNPEISHAKKQQISDKFFGKNGSMVRKDILLTSKS